MLLNRFRPTMLVVLCVAVFLRTAGTPTSFAAFENRPTVALVLGGGSSRGLSHIGLLKAFEEEGIPVDYIVGTSMGSVVAGLYAAGLGADNLDYMVRHMEPAQLFAPSLPLGGGLIDSNRFEIFLDELTGGIDFADAPIPFYTVVIDLVEGQEETLSAGRLSRGILASMSVPGVFPPVQIDDGYYIDGGLRNLTPVTVARQTGADVVVAVDVRRTVEDVDHDTLSSNLQLTLMLLLAQDTDEELERADFVIAPRVDSGSYMDYERMDHFIAEGYRAAKEAAPRIQELLREHSPDMRFSPRLQGLEEAAFARRMASAVAAYEREGGPPGWSVRFGFAALPGGTSRAEASLSWPLGGRERGRSLFGSVVAAWRGQRFEPALGFGAGDCSRLCGTVFLRHGGSEGWWPGIAWQGRVATAVRYEGELVAGGGMAASPEGRLTLVWPGIVQVEKGNEWRLTLQRGDSGLLPSTGGALRAEAAWRRYLTGRPADVLEAVRTTTAPYVGVGVGFGEGAGAVTASAEIGLALEGRLFGLYPVHSRVGLRYRGGEHPWALHWTIGQWVFP